MNDAACDPARAGCGRAPWRTTTAPAAARCTGSIATASVERMLDGLTISNGIGWSPDGDTMYLADTMPGVIHAFRSTRRGTISEAGCSSTSRTRAARRTA